MNRVRVGHGAQGDPATGANLSAFPLKHLTLSRLAVPRFGAPLLTATRRGVCDSSHPGGLPVTTSAERGGDAHGCRLD